MGRRYKSRAKRLDDARSTLQSYADRLQDIYDDEDLDDNAKLVAANGVMSDFEFSEIESLKEEVEQWVQTDEAIKSGRLSYEIHPWMTQKGNCFK